MANTRQDVEVRVKVKDLASGKFKGIGGAGKKAGASIAGSFLKAQIVFRGLSLIVGKVTRELKDLIFGVAARADKIAKLSQQVGITTEALSELKLAAELSGTDLQKLVLGLRNINRGLKETEDGAGKAAAAFKKYGIATKNTDGTLRSADAVLEDIADAVGTMADQTLRTAVAMELLGDRAGPALIPLIAGGSKAIREMREEARRLGLSLSGDVARQFEDMNDAVTRMDAAFEGLKLTIASELAPVIESLSDVITDFTVQGKSSIRRWAQDTIRAMAFVANATDVVVSGLRAGAEVFTFGLASDATIKSIARERRARKAALDSFIRDVIASSDELVFRTNAISKGLIDAYDEEQKHARLAIRLFEAMRREVIKTSKELDVFASIARGAAEQLELLAKAGDIESQLKLELRLLNARTDLDRERIVLADRFKRQMREINRLAEDAGGGPRFEKLREILKDVNAGRLGAIENGDDDRPKIAPVDRFVPVRRDRPSIKTTEIVSKDFNAGIRKSVESLVEQASAFNLGMRAMDSFADGWAEMVTSLVSGSESISAAVKSMSASLLSDLSRLFAQRSFASLLGSSFGIAFPGAPIPKPASGGGNVTMHINAGQGVDLGAVQQAARTGILEGARQSSRFQRSLRGSVAGGLT